MAICIHCTRKVADRIAYCVANYCAGHQKPQMTALGIKNHVRNHLQLNWSAMKTAAEKLQFSLQLQMVSHVVFDAQRSNLQRDLQYDLQLCIKHKLWGQMS